MKMLQWHPSLNSWTAIVLIKHRIDLIQVFLTPIVSFKYIMVHDAPASNHFDNARGVKQINRDSML